MSGLEKDVPPAGEEIHLPGGSLQPLGLSVGLTVAIVGVTTSIVLVVAGVLLSVAMLYGWIRDARKEFDELPAEHAHH
ncbi:MAG: hypothetical protein JWO90_1243 [Solirubrobacterales bacterium]|jgi:hypothetical protein|nr:hypothetical protein [Solirubrobacterales bacterium]